MLSTSADVLPGAVSSGRRSAYAASGFAGASVDSGGREFMPNHDDGTAMSSFERLIQPRALVPTGTMSSRDMVPRC